MQITSQKDVENDIMQKVVLQTKFDIFSFLRRLQRDSVVLIGCGSLISFLFRIKKHSWIFVFMHSSIY